MKQQRPIIHGLDHRPNGPDPIPGLGAGGGAVTWEDVGATTPAEAPFVGYYDGLDVAVPSTGFASSALLPWNGIGGSDQLMNPSAAGATQLTFKKAGLYVCSVTVIGTGMTNDNGMDVVLNYGGNDPHMPSQYEGRQSVIARTAWENVGQPICEATITGPAWCKVGAPLQVSLQHFSPDGTSESATFRIYRAFVAWVRG